MFLIAIKDLNIQKSLEIDELVTHFAYELMTEKEKELEEAEMKRKVAEDKKLKLELKIEKIEKDNLENSRKFDNIENQMKDNLENSRKIIQYIESKITKKEMREKKKETKEQKI